MTECECVVKSPVGLHARPAAAFVQESLKHECAIIVECFDKRADAKSILQVLALGVKHGQKITIQADGPGESEAVRSLASLIDRM